MAAIEYSYVTSIEVATAGASGLQYFQIGPAVQPIGSVFVIKDINFYSNTGIGGSTGTAFNYILYSSNDNIGTNLIPICCNPRSAINGSVVINPFASNSFYVSQPFLALNVNMTAPGIIYISISYCLIPNTNILYNNFMSINGIIAQNAFSPILSQAQHTSILTTLCVLNIDPVNTYNVAPILSNLSTLVLTNGQETLAPYEHAIIAQPIYIAGTNSSYPLYEFGISVTGIGTGVNYYLSSIYNIQE